MPEEQITASSLKELEETLPNDFKPKDTKFNRIFIKLDKTLFKISKKVILYFVKLSKYQNNKYKILLNFRKVNMVLFFVAVFVMTPIGWVRIMQRSGSGLTIPAMSFVFFIFVLPLIFILLMEGFDYIKNKIKVVDYEILFLLRKHPAVYYNIKTQVEMKFVIEKKIRIQMLRSRFWMSLFFYSFIFFLNLFAGFGLEDSYLLFFVGGSLIGWIDMYIDYVFDFDKPDGKRRKAKKDLTELMQKVLKDLARAISPLPRPI